MPGGLIVDQFLRHLPDFVDGDLALQVDAHGFPGFFQGRIVFMASGGRSKARDKFAAVGRQVRDEAQVAGFFAG